MFKPEYILEDVALFGLAETMRLVAAKFKRMGKTTAVANTMAYHLVLNTVFVGE
jgi:hypothetical protein